MVSKLTQVFKLAEFLNSSKLIKPETGASITTCQLARDLLENRKLIFFGEIHGQPQVVNMEVLLLKILVEDAKNKNPPHKVNVFLEHFNLEQQSLINSYLHDNIDEEELFKKYKETGDEGHDVEKYTPLLKYAKENFTSITLNGSFVPRYYYFITYSMKRIFGRSRHKWATAISLDWILVEVMSCLVYKFTKIELI